MTVVVGRNNAGKSTVVEALRLVALVVSRYQNLGFHLAPDWTTAGRGSFGVRPSLRNMEITFQGMFHRYADPPGIITAEFEDGESVTVYIADEERFHAVIRDHRGRIIRSKGAAADIDLPSVNILPQVGPVQKREVILSSDYVRAAVSSSLAPLHFRNQLIVFGESFPRFCEMVEETWPGVAIQELIYESRNPGTQIFLEVRNEDFVGEVSLMGHGLQMWLQTMWFLALAENSETVILDEPDVYMHPDLQRRIIRFLRDRHRQCIITTHSVEILSEVQADEILIVDKRRPASRFAASIPAVQRLIESVGSAHNISLTRLWHARKFILVEGKDIGFLKAFQDTLFPESQSPIDAMPSMPIGGWGGWNYAVGSAMLLQNAVGESIITYCVLDSDYHTPEEVAQRKGQAKDRNVQLHIWSRKEIENYLLSAQLIYRVIEASLARRTTGPTAKEIHQKMVLIASSLSTDVHDGLATEILARDRKLTLATANKRARERIEATEARDGNILALVPGKTAISRISEWSQNEFGVSITPIKLAREIRVSELPREVQNVVSAIERLEPFENSP